MIPYIKGKVATQAHVGVPEGTFEEEYARNGFFGKYAHLYRSEPPVDWLSIEGPLKPRAYDLNENFVAANAAQLAQGYFESRRAVLANSDVVVAVSKLSETPSYYFRNADGDEVIFVHGGKGVLETDFGPLSYVEGDYLLIPRGTVYRFNPAGGSGSPTTLLITESFSEVDFPEKGMLGQHALFDPAVIRVPTPEGAGVQTGKTPCCELRIKRQGAITRVVYPHSPINTVGWKGTLCVKQLNVQDIRPVLSDRYHLPPSAHTTFVGQNFVICSFLPRPLENGDPAALKVPFYHSNIDFDEVIFYHSGEFFSREGIAPGMLTFHPQGIHHGPQKKAVERSVATQKTSEVAIMIDTRNPLEPTEFAKSRELADYWRSWK